jgi:hypothetical protein
LYCDSFFEAVIDLFDFLILSYTTTIIIAQDRGGH